MWAEFRIDTPPPYQVLDCPGKRGCLDFFIPFFFRMDSRPAARRYRQTTPDVAGADGPGKIIAEPGGTGSPEFLVALAAHAIHGTPAAQAGTVAHATRAIRPPN